MLWSAYLFFSTAFCLYFFCVTLINVHFFKKNSWRPTVFEGLKVSVLIPARDEAENIIPCLDSLLKQSYRHYEILVVDDHSVDATFSILQDYARRFPAQIRIQQAPPLPSGWYGKQHALHALIPHATGDILFFVDADTIHSEHSIAFAVSNLERHRADFLSVYAQHCMPTWGEKMVLPVMYLATAFFSMRWVFSHPHPFFSLAIGQVMMCKREAFLKIGGFEPLKHEINDDLSLAKNFKKAGFKTIFLDAKSYVRCRMYKGYFRSLRGISKNIYAAMDKSALRVAGLALVFFLAVELPFFILLWKGLHPGPIPSFLWIAPLLFVSAWTLTLHDRKVSYWALVGYPLVFFNLLLLGFVSTLRTGYGRGVLWKGRWVK